MAEAIQIKGLKELSKELEKLGQDIGKKALRSAVSGALTPTFKKIKLAAPVGGKAHRTYKGRLVAPGFLSRNIKRSSRFKNGKATAKIKTAPEAFYGVTFLDKGIPGKIDAHNWFAQKFENDRAAVEKLFATLLDKKIKKLTK